MLLNNMRKLQRWNRMSKFMLLWSDLKINLLKSREHVRQCPCWRRQCHSVIKVTVVKERQQCLWCCHLWHRHFKSSPGPFDECNTRAVSCTRNSWTSTPDEATANGCRMAHFVMLVSWWRRRLRLSHELGVRRIAWSWVGSSSAIIRT